MQEMQEARRELQQALQQCHTCWRHADVPYDTAAFMMQGVFHPSRRVWLCKICHTRLMNAIDVLESERASTQARGIVA